MENVFDGLFSRAFRSGISPIQIGRRLIREIDASRKVDAQGRRVVPNTFVVHLSSADRKGFAELEAALAHELTEAARNHVRAEGYHCEDKVRVHLHTDPALRKGRCDISARHEASDGSPRRSADDDPVARPSPSPVPEPIPAVFPSAPDPEVHRAGDGALFSAAPAVLTLSNGQRIELHDGTYVVGRNLDCDIVVSDTNVSRHHAELVCAGGEVVIRDLGSTNGTKVNGVGVVGDQILQHDDVVNFGSAQVRFEVT